jgi:DNA-binding NarL/FixJ family response regulator
MSAPSIVIADDHPLVLRGLRELLAQSHDVEVLAVCSDGMQALDAIRQLRPNLAILDVSMPRLTGLDVVAAIQTERLGTRALLLAASATSRDVMTAMATGAYGFLLKESAPEEILHALRDIADGHKCMPFDLIDHQLVANAAAKPVSIDKVLTQAEWRVMDLAARGLSNKEIGRQLQVSEGTAKVHLHHIYRKLGVGNRTELANVALRYSESKSSQPS